MEGELSVLSWNVNGLNNYKLGCDEFVNIISKHDICFIYESWTNSRSNIDINGYVAHNFYRKFVHRNARRCSGGLVLYYREHLKDGIEIVKNNHDTIIWIRLKHDFFNIEKDMYICGAYVWGADSPAYNTIDVDLFEILENDISLFQESGNIMIAGDFNSRVGNKCDYIVYDSINSCVDHDCYIPDNNLYRASVDSSQNSHGLKLLDLCKTCSLRILNGRVGDSNHFTFFSKNGCIGCRPSRRSS